MSNKAKARKPYAFDVSILGTSYRVKFDNPKDGGRLAGCCNTDKKAIYISLQQSTAQQKSTLIHECIHAYLHEGGLQEYAHDETLTYALEILMPKMARLFKTIGVIE